MAGKSITFFPACVKRRKCDFIYGFRSQSWLIKKRDHICLYATNLQEFMVRLNTCSDVSPLLSTLIVRSIGLLLSRYRNDSSTLATWGRYSFSTLLSFIPTPALATRCIMSTRKTVIYTLIYRDVGIRIGVRRRPFFLCPFAETCKETLGCVSWPIMMRRLE